MKVNTEQFEKIGMTVLKTKPIRNKNITSMAFPEFEKPFNPKGISLKEARKAMRKCK